MAESDSESNTSTSSNSSSSSDSSSSSKSSRSSDEEMPVKSLQNEETNKIYESTTVKLTGTEPESLDDLVITEVSNSNVSPGVEDLVKNNNDNVVRERTETSSYEPLVQSVSIEKEGHLILENEASDLRDVEPHQTSSESPSKQKENCEEIQQDTGKNNFDRKESNKNYESKREENCGKRGRGSSLERRRRNRRSDSRSRSRSRERSIERRRKERERRHAEQEAANRDRKRHHGSEDTDAKLHTEKEKESVKDSKGNISERQRRTVDLLTSRTGGAYIPPAKLRLLQAEITDKTSAAYQRIAWEALKKSIHGYINKVNVDNIAIITRELLKENIVRGRGLLCRSIIQAQAASPTFTHVYAALVAIINSKFPNIGELLLKRLVIQFKRAFRRNDKNVCLSSSCFIAHLVNQRVAHEILALEILTLLVETPTDDSVEVAIAFLKESGMKLTEVSSKGIGAIFEMLKNILHEGKLDKRVQYMIEVVFQVRKDGFKDHQSVLESLELVEEDDQFTHLLMLDEATNPEDALNAFKFDEKYETNEDKYKGLSKEILGSDDSESGTHGSGSDSNSNSSDSDDSDEKKDDSKAEAGDIIDNTETNMIALRRTIYLTINSSLDYEECAHKLMKMQLKPGQEIELCHMFLDCCAEQRTYEKFYGLLAQRFCSINKIYIEPFEEIFRDTYQTTHRLDTNRLRNVSKFFAHLLFTDAIGWDILECIKLNEDDTTSSSRIFIKILFQELAEYMGLGKLNSKLKDEVLTESLTGLFPKDNPRNTRFAINFFTSIGLGGLTDELRQFLKNAPKSVPAINLEILAKKPSSSESSSSSSTTTTDSSSSSTSSSSSSTSTTSSSSSNESSESEDDRKKLKKSKLSTVRKKKRVEPNKIKTKEVKKNKKRKDKNSDEESSSEETSTDSESSHNRKNRYKKHARSRNIRDEKHKKLSKNEEVKNSKRKLNCKENEETGKKIRREDCDRRVDSEDRKGRERRGDDGHRRYKSRDYSRKSHTSRYSECEDNFNHGRSSNDKVQRSNLKPDRNDSKERG